MTENDIIKYIDMVVEKTVATLKNNGMLKEPDERNYADISYILTDYYQNGQNVPKIERALNSVKGDDYFEIIPYYYGDGMKIDSIAKVMGVDTSTIVRNKKRLCMLIYTSMI